jgi:hypothetical protein
MVQLAGLGVVEASKITGEDVTADYIDAKAHLKVYLARRRFLYGLMADAVTVDVHEPGAAPVTPEEQIVDPSIGRAFARGVQGLLTVVTALVIGFGYLLPLLVILGAGYGVYRLTRRRRPSSFD